MRDERRLVRPAATTAAREVRRAPAPPVVPVDLAQVPADELLGHLTRLLGGLNMMAAEVTARVRRLELQSQDAARAAHLAERLTISEAAEELGVNRRTTWRWAYGLVSLDAQRKAPRAAWLEAREQSRARAVGAPSSPVRKVR